MTGNSGLDWDRYPAWVRRVPGILGGTWLIGGLIYILWTRLSYQSLSVLGKSVVTGVCLSGIAFGVSAMWPSKGQEEVRRDDMRNLWAFVRGPAPDVQYKRALWAKMRRTMAMWLLVVLFMIVGMVLGVLGLLHQ